jgi:hypothetical protein
MLIPIIVSGARQDRKNLITLGDGRQYFIKRGPVEDCGGLLLVEALKALTPKFEGALSHQNHAHNLHEALTRPLLGVIRRSRWDDSALAILAELEVDARRASLVAALRSAGWGFSPVLEGLAFRRHCKLQNQRTGVWIDVLVCDSIDGVRSVDCVARPSLAGRFFPPLFDRR